MKEYRNSNTGINLVFFLGALATGIFLGAILAPKRGEEYRKDLMKAAHKFRRAYEDNKRDIKEHVWDVFGEVNDELEKAYLEAYEHVTAIADLLRDEASLTRNKYDSIVQDTVKRVGKAHDWTRTYVDNLIEDLKNEWERVK